LALVMLATLLPSLAAPGAMAQEATATPAPPGSAEEQGSPAGPPVVLSLQDALRGALENNLDIVVRSYDPLRSETRVIASESGFDPFLSASARNAETDQRGVTSFTGVFIPFTSNQKSHLYNVHFEDPVITGGHYSVDLNGDDSDSFFQLGSNPASSSKQFNTSYLLTFSQPLLRNLGASANRSLIIVSRNTLGATEARFRQTVIDTLATAEKAYWDLDFAHLNLKTRLAALQLAKDFLDQNRIKVRVGTLAPIEITQAEAEVADREEAVIIAQAAVRTAEDAMRLIMNLPKTSPDWSRPIQPSDMPAVVEITPDMDAAVTSGMAHRPDLEAARLDLKSRETDLAFRSNQKRWGLDFQGTYGNSGFDGSNYGNSIDDLRDRNQTDWTLRLNLLIPLRNRLAGANYTDADYALTQARYLVDSLEQLARIEVRNAVRTLETNLKRVKSAQVNVRLQREKLSAEQKKFENGMSTSFQVLQFQTDLTTAEARENLAIVDYNKSQAELQRVQGTLLEARNMTMPGRDFQRKLSFPPESGPGDQGGTDGATLFLGGQPTDSVRLPGDFVWNGRPLQAREGRTPAR
jgi:outer membrane protein TolC